MPIDYKNKRFLVVDDQPLARESLRAIAQTAGAFSVNDFCRWASIGRTAAYAEMKAGRLAARKFGRRTFIALAEAERWLNALPVHRT